MDKLTLKLNDKLVSVEMDDNGRYCLNDIYKASGGAERHKPSRWLRSNSAPNVVDLTSTKSGTYEFPDKFDSYVVKTKRNRATVTFAPLKVVYKYAGWVSKDFEDAVYSAFTELTTGNVTEAANIASSVALTPEIISRYEKLKAKLDITLKEKYPDNKHIYSNIYRLIGKAVSGYTPKELTGGFSSVIERIESSDNLPAMNAYIATLELLIMMISFGVTDYHKLAAALKVKTSKNGSILEEIK